MGQVVIRLGGGSAGKFQSEPFLGESGSGSGGSGFGKWYG